MHDQKVNVGGLNDPDEVDDFLYALNEASLLDGSYSVSREEIPERWYGAVGRYGDTAMSSSVVFTSPINVMDTPVIRVPPSVLSLCDAIQQQRTNLEFSILLKGTWTKDGFVVTSDDYVIPTQTVSMAAVDYDADEVSRLMAEGYNCVLHSHPMNMRVFSGSDEDTINVNFDASILYCQGDLCDARVCISIVPRLKLRLEAKIEWLPMSGAIRGLEKIAVAPAPKRSSYRNYNWKRDGLNDDVVEMLDGKAFCRPAGKHSPVARGRGKKT